MIPKFLYSPQLKDLFTFEFIGWPVLSVQTGPHQALTKDRNSDVEYSGTSPRREEGLRGCRDEGQGCSLGLPQPVQLPSRDQLPVSLPTPYYY